jgi:hypothetical protein
MTDAEYAITTREIMIVMIPPKLLEKELSPLDV